MSPADLGYLGSAGVTLIRFGSRAAGVFDSESDHDVLVIADGRPAVSAEIALSERIDLVWMSPSEAARCLPGSELGAHVERWGQLIHGDAAWLRLGPARQAAVLHKERLIRAMLHALEAHADNLDPEDRRRLGRSVRRDLQRWDEMSRGVGPSPRPMLDHAWTIQRRLAREWTQRITASSRPAPRTAWHEWLEE